MATSIQVFYFSWQVDTICLTFYFLVNSTPSIANLTIVLVISEFPDISVASSLWIRVNMYFLYFSVVIKWKLESQNRNFINCQGTIMFLFSAHKHFRKWILSYVFIEATNPTLIFWYFYTLYYECYNIS